MNTTAQSIEKLIRSNEALYGPMAEKAKEESAKLARIFGDQPDWVSGWFHDFACPHCASTLAFDPEMAYAPPNTFICPQCKASLKDQRYDEAWVYCYRAAMANMLESTAVCALLGDREAQDAMERFFDFYAHHYAGFAVHGHGSGKLMPQVLDEAVWCLKVLRAFYPCRKLFQEEKRQRWYRQLFLPLAALIDEPELQKTIHNHVLWHKCALGAIALCFEDGELLRHALDEPWGIREQAAKGFTGDHLWREGSVLYHYYALEALTGFCQLFSDQHPEDPLLHILEKAYLAPLALSWDQWHFPSVNDGWYPLTLERFADQFHRAAAASGSKALWEQVERIADRCPQAISPTASLLLNRPPKIAEIWTHTGLAVLNHPWFAQLKSGVLTRSHMHRDYLSVAIPPFSVDLGTPGYGHPLYKGWYKLSPAHNTIAIDGDQPDCALPNHLKETEQGVRASVDGNWPGVISASRTLTPDGDRLHDRTEIACQGEHVIDWFFHSEGQAEFSTKPGEPASLGSAPGYEHFQNIRRIPCDELTVSFTLDGRILRLQIPTKDLEVFTAQSPGNPADALRTSLILRKKGDQAVFQVTYTQALKP